MKRLLAFAFAAVLLVSCKQAESGTMTVTNALTLPVRVEISENYESETVTLAAGETITKDYDHYRSIYLPDETPRARYDESGDAFTILPLAPKTVTIYVTNAIGDPITLVNAKESDTAEYLIPVGATNLAVDFSYYRYWELVAKGATEDSITIKKTVVTTTQEASDDSDEETTVDTTYILIATPGN